jgi:hypothetical protein
VRQAVSEAVDAVCEQVDVVRRNAADGEQKNHVTEGRAHGPGGSVDVVFPLLKERRRVAQVGRARFEARTLSWARSVGRL